MCAASLQLRILLRWQPEEYSTFALADGSLYGLLRFKVRQCTTTFGQFVQLAFVLKHKGTETLLCGAVEQDKVPACCLLFKRDVYDLERWPASFAVPFTGCVRCWQKVLTGATDFTAQSLPCC